MKNLKMIIGLGLVATFSASAMAGGYGKNKRKFKKAKTVNKEVFVNQIEGKTFKCNGYFSDNTNGVEFYQFQTMAGKIINNFDDSSYSLKSGLTATESRMGDDVKVYFRITKSGELVAHQASGYTQQYIYCPKANVSTGTSTTIETILDKKIEAVAVKENGEKVIITTALVESADGKLVHTNYISVLNTKNEITKTVEAKDFMSVLNLDKEFSGIPPFPELVEYNNEFYLNGSFFSDSSSKSIPMTIKFSVELNDAQIFKANEDGKMEINPANGTISYYTIDHEIRNGTLVTSYDNAGNLLNKKHYDEMRGTTGFEGAILNNGSLAIASYCDSDFNSAYGCPNRDRNYPGVSLVTSDGELKKFFTGFGNLDMTKPTIIKALVDGSFLVGFSDYSGLMTLVKYDSEGNYLNSYGIYAKDEVNKSLVIKPKFQHEKFSITKDGMVYFPQGNRLYSLSL